MSEPVNSVDYWVDALTKDTDPEHFGFTDEGLYYTTRNKRNYGRWMWDCGYNAGLVNLQTKVNTYCVPQWISVKDRLPDDGMECYLVLVDLPYLVEKYIDIAWYNAYNMYGRDDFNPWYHREERINYEGITHWMPLPKPPKEKNNE